jgi:hypothetical protein
MTSTKNTESDNSITKLAREVLETALNNSDTASELKQLLFPKNKSSLPPKENLSDNFSGALDNINSKKLNDLKTLFENINKDSSTVNELESSPSDTTVGDADKNINKKDDNLTAAPNISLASIADIVGNPEINSVINGLFSSISARSCMRNVHKIINKNTHTKTPYKFVKINRHVYTKRTKTSHEKKTYNKADVITNPLESTTEILYNEEVAIARFSCIYCDKNSSITDNKRIVVTCNKGCVVNYHKNCWSLIENPKNCFVEGCEGALEKIQIKLNDRLLRETILTGVTIFNNVENQSQEPKIINEINQEPLYYDYDIVAVTQPVDFINKDHIVESVFPITPNTNSYRDIKVEEYVSDSIGLKYQKYQEKIKTKNKRRAKLNRQMKNKKIIFANHFDIKHSVNNETENKIENIQLETAQLEVRKLTEQLNNKQLEIMKLEAKISVTKQSEFPKLEINKSEIKQTNIKNSAPMLLNDNQIRFAELESKESETGQLNIKKMTPIQLNDKQLELNNQNNIAGLKASSPIFIPQGLNDLSLYQKFPRANATRQNFSSPQYIPPYGVNVSGYQNTTYNYNFIPSIYTNYSGCVIYR